MTDGSVLSRLAFIRSLPLAALYLGLCFPVILMLTYVSPPFQAPDEANHFLRAVGIASGQIVAHKFSDIAAGSMVDGNAVRVAYAFDYLHFHPDQKLDLPAMADLEAIHWGEVPKTAGIYSNTAIYPFFMYLPAAVGIRAGKMLGWTIIDTMYLARLLTALCATGLAATALAICRKGRMFLFVVLSLPMVMSLFASVSQDALSISFAALVIAIWSHYLDRDEDIPTALRCLAALLLGAIIAARLPFLPLYGLMGLPTTRRRRLFSRSWLSRGDMLSIGVGLVPIVVGMIGVEAAKIPFRADAGVSASGQLSALLHDPMSGVRVLTSTLELYAGHYAYQMVGVLGWFDVVFPRGFYVWAALCLALSAYLECLTAETGLRGLRAILHGLMLLAVTIGVFLALYLSWTTVGAPAVDGVQGRYFFVPVVFAAVLLPMGRSVPASVRLFSDYARPLLAITVGLINLWIVPVTVLHRYYG